jgi:GNAT superfamily N-acetyltransferase
MTQESMTQDLNRTPLRATLAPVELSDADEICVLMTRVIATSVTQDEHLLRETVENVSSNVTWWLEQPERCVHLKAGIDGRIVGVVLVKDFWNLCSLFVAPEWHRQGLGRALVEAACEACRDRSPKEAILLNAATDAIAFYEHLGFTRREATRPLPAGFQAMQRPL